MGSSLIDTSFVINESSSKEEVAMWLGQEELGHLARHFAAYDGKFLLALSSDQLERICGTADGILLHMKLSETRNFVRKQREQQQTQVKAAAPLSPPPPSPSISAAPPESTARREQGSDSSPSLEELNPSAPYAEETLTTLNAPLRDPLVSDGLMD